MPTKTNILEEIRTAYRRALLALGQNPTTHVYDLDDSFLSAVSNRKEGKVLRRIKGLYCSLGFMRRRIFLTESLEKGSIYPFWYYGILSEKTYQAETREISRRAREVFA